MNTKGIHLSTDPLAFIGICIVWMTLLKCVSKHVKCMFLHQPCLMCHLGFRDVPALLYH